MDIPGLRQQILANATQAIAFRFPDHDATSAPRLLTHRSGDVVKGVLVSSNGDDDLVRISGNEAGSTSEALANLLVTTEEILEVVITAWDARKDAVVDDEWDESEGAAPMEKRKSRGAKVEGGNEEVVVVEEEEDVVPPPNTKRKPGRPKKVVRRGRPRKSVA